MMVPEFGGRTPETALNRVVLPAPLGPIKAWIVRSATSIDMPVRAWKSPKRTPIASTLRMGAARPAAGSAIGFSPLAKDRKAASNAPEPAGEEEHDRDEGK